VLRFGASIDSRAPEASSNPSQVPASSGAPGAATSPPDALPLPEASRPLAAGSYLSRLGAPYPDAVIDVPAGWSSLGSAWVHKNPNTPEWVGFMLWAVTEVYTDGCHWKQPLIAPGPSVHELAAALASRPLRDATPPVSVVLNGVVGEYLRWSVPEDIDFATCDVDPPDGKHYFESWKGSAGGTDRYQQGPGQIDELWILDAAGHRVVVDAQYMPGASQEDIAELRAVVDSIRFVGVERSD
jgi:hypothetical protein